jgi:hypothetical protein
MNDVTPRTVSGGGRAEGQSGHPVGVGLEGAGTSAKGRYVSFAPEVTGRN